MGQVDGTKQAGCEWAARVFHLALRNGKRWNGAAGITEMRYHVSGSLHHLTLRCFTVLVHKWIEFISSLIPVQLFLDSCLDPASKSMERVLLHQPYEGQLLKLGVGGHKSIYAGCFLSHLSHSFLSWLFLHSVLLQQMRQILDIPSWLRRWCGLVFIWKTSTGSYHNTLYL